MKHSKINQSSLVYQGKYENECECFMVKLTNATFYLEVLVNNSDMNIFNNDWALQTVGKQYHIQKNTVQLQLYSVHPSDRQIKV